MPGDKRNIQPATAAAAWFAQRRRPVTPAEELAFQTWMLEDPLNKAAFDDVTDAWRISGLATRDPDRERKRANQS